MQTFSRRAFLAQGAKLAAAYVISACLPFTHNAARTQRAYAPLVEQPTAWAQDSVIDDEQTAAGIDVKVVGIGGGGCSALGYMVEQGIWGAEYIAVDSDPWSLANSGAPNRLHLTRFVPGRPEFHRSPIALGVSQEGVDRLWEALGKADLVLILAGMGGGTGTRFAPLVASIARQAGALAVAVVTKPLGFEPHQGQRQAVEGIRALEGEADTVIVISNDRLPAVGNRTVKAACRLADEVMYHCVQTITELITVPGVVSVDFADIKAVVGSRGGLGQLSVGHGRGKDSAVKAAQSAMSGALWEAPLNCAKGVLLGIRGGGNLTLREISEAAEMISRAVAPEAILIFGVTIDQEMDGETRVTLIATGLGSLRTR